MDRRDGGRIALVSARAHVELDDDLGPLADALAACSVDAVVAPWDDATVDWADFSLAVLRSPWDYARRYEEFLAWLDRVAAVTEVANPVPVVRWNTDKRYLVALAAEGTPVVPTTVLEPGGSVADHVVDPGPTGELVVKPVVSAGSKDTARHRDHRAARRHAEELLAAGRSVLVQPYQLAVDTVGETAMVFLDGEFSHCLRKGPLLAPDAPPTSAPFAPEDMSAREPSADELALARHALGASARLTGVTEPLLYARVDCIPGDDGAPLLLELELAEPSLFVGHAPGAAERFAIAVLRRLHR